VKRLDSEKLAFTAETMVYEFMYTVYRSPFVMSRIFLLGFMLFLMLARPLAAQSGGKVVRLAPEMDEIVPAKSEIDKLAKISGFAEGPIWLPNGSLLFSDIPGNEIMRWAPGAALSVFKKRSGFDGANAPAGAFIGSNGLTLDKSGRLTICEHGNRRVTRIEKNGRVTVLADRYEGKRLNSPNDLVYKSDGSLYFTDPPHGLSKEDDDPAKELKFNGVYRVAAGKVNLLTTALDRPNGLAFSPDEKFLYVGNSSMKRKVWMRFEVRPDGTLGQGQVFFDATSEQGGGVPDGLKVDQKGNLYGTGPGGIWIFSPAGLHLGTIVLPELPANCAWGDTDGKTLYMTARTGLYRIRLNVAGIRP
jgi:gluconolactonase